MKHPITQSLRYLFFYIAIWAGILVAHVIALTLLYNIPSGIAISDSLVFNIIYCFLGLALWYPVFYHDIDKNSVSHLIISHLSIMILTLLFWVSVGVFVMKAIYSESIIYISFVDAGIPWRVFTGIFYYMALILIYYLIIYSNNLKEHIIKESYLKDKINEAELKTLKSQINPHFLFNSLNSIGSLTITNPEKAHEMIIKLSGFLRYSLAHDPTKLIPLKQEFDNMEAYISVEKVRFGNKLVFKKSVSPECEKIMVPFLILQPLIENAIKHGVYESMQPITIEVICQPLSDHSVKITITNGFDPEAVSLKGTGTGLKNIQERLKIIYELSDLLTFEKRADEFEVSLVFPKKALFKPSVSNF